MTQADQLAEINRKQRQKIMQLKNRTQKIYNKPSPIVSGNVTPDISYTYSNSIKLSSKGNTLDLLKQYQSNKTNSQKDYSHDQYSIGSGGAGLGNNLNTAAQKSVDYNSNLFKILKDQFHSTDKQSQIMGNGSSVSNNSGGHTQGFQGNQVLKDDSLINKIDELLKKNQNKSKGGIKNVYDQYLQKKSLTNSSVISNNTSSKNSSNIQLNLNLNEKIKSNSTSTYLQKLKTIEEQKATLTIDRQQLDTKSNKKRNQKQKQLSNKQVQRTKHLSSLNQMLNMKKPPISPPLASLNSIERQKRKIKQTMYELKKQNQASDFHEKDSLILQFSDNQSQKQVKDDENKCISQNSHEKSGENKEQTDKMLKRTALQQEKTKLQLQLIQIERQLQQLEQEQNQQI